MHYPHKSTNLYLILGPENKMKSIFISDWCLPNELLYLYLKIRLLYNIENQMKIIRQIAIIKPIKSIFEKARHWWYDTRSGSSALGISILF